MTDWILSSIWYACLLAFLLGLLAVVRPLPRVRLGTRGRGVRCALLATALLAANAVALPGRQTVAPQVTEHDVLTPSFHFREVHVRSIAAPRDRVKAAINLVTAEEIWLFLALTSIRRLGRPGPESILNAPGQQPILDVATRSGFLRLADTEREVVVGAIVGAPPGFNPGPVTRDTVWFRQLEDPGIVKATMSFALEPVGDGRTRVTTETRVYATDRGGLRRFTPYWRTIFPGSWILRHTWLTAIARRAERV
ncbi:MAG: hypothetical protein ACT4QD_06110 [Acidobacteriota bacterium]